MKVFRILPLIVLTGCQECVTISIPYTKDGFLLFSGDYYTGGIYPEMMENGIGNDGDNYTFVLNFIVKPDTNWKIKMIRTRFIEGDHEVDTLYPYINSSSLVIEFLKDTAFYVMRSRIYFKQEEFYEINFDPPVELCRDSLYTIRFFLDSDGDSTIFTPETVPYAYFSFHYNSGNAGRYYFVWQKISPDSEIVDSRIIFIPMEVYQ